MPLQPNLPKLTPDLGKGTSDILKINVVSGTDKKTLVPEVPDAMNGYQGRYDSLYAFTKNSKYYTIGKYGESEGHLFVGTLGKSYVTLNLPLYQPIQYDSKLFRHMSSEYNPLYEQSILDVDTQKALLAAGIRTVEGVKIPSDPKTHLVTGGLHRKPGSITDTGIFGEVSGSNNTESERDRRYYVRTRVPDSANYHYERQKDDPSIPFLEKMHAQYQRPIELGDPDFEDQIAKARYLSGMTPYLTNEEAKQFEHFTYWRYKNLPDADLFRGAYVHIFITRPDLHLLDRFDTGPRAKFRNDVMANRELYSLVMLNPEGALSLIGRWQTKAMTDINLFLSNRACGVSLSNETLDDHSFVDNFTKINMSFGGRMDNQEGNFDITFAETDDMSVSNTILLWMKYIHATYTGLLSPLCDGKWTDRNNVNMGHHHPIWRRLDSLASAYVIATDMTQRKVIFWRKYFGIYPTHSSGSGMSFSDSRMAEDVRKVTTSFKYTTFRTNNIADLYAFNRLSDLNYTFTKGNEAFKGDMYQVKDPNTIYDHNIISGLPFVALENHITDTPGEYNRTLPRQMITPHLLFTRTDGAFLPNGTPEEMSKYVNRYWGGLSRNVDKLRV